MIVTLLLKNQGFYSILFFVLNHYLYCKKNKLNYKMNTDNWLFKSIDGWVDYFKAVELHYAEDTSTETIYYDQYNTVLDSFTLQEYREAIQEMYIYNEKTKAQIEEVKQQYHLNNNYSAIFIRRGDKLIQESNYYHASIYIQRLLLKDPTCKRIFIQTDDYNCVLEAKEFIEYHKLNIEIITLCKEHTKGMVIISHQQNLLQHVLNQSLFSKNNNYLLSNKTLASFKPVDQMNPDEIYQHTMDMLVGIDIVLQSNVCIIDFESNVSRFIKLAHSNPQNVYEINNRIIDFSKQIFPAYEF